MLWPLGAAGALYTAGFTSGGVALGNLIFDSIGETKC